MRIFWDTNLFIYVWERGPNSENAQEFAEWILSEKHQLITSALTIGEILVWPRIQGYGVVLSEYESDCPHPPQYS